MDEEHTTYATIMSFNEGLVRKSLGIVEAIIIVFRESMSWKIKLIGPVSNVSQVCLNCVH